MNKWNEKKTNTKIRAANLFSKNASFEQIFVVDLDEETYSKIYFNKEFLLNTLTAKIKSREMIISKEQI